MKQKTLLIVLSASALTLGWWLAGHVDTDHGRNGGIPAAWRRKPMNVPVCGIPGQGMMAMPPAPPEDPFGATMYPNLHRAQVTMLPVAGIVSQLFSIAAPAPGTDARKDVSGGAAKNSEVAEPAMDVQVVSTLLQEYRRATGAMPAGQLNDEVVRHLQGQNVKGIAVLPKTHPMINADGELMDRWGTPYFFHAESSYVMTVRSAGPDKKLWNTDDILSESEMMLAPQGAIVAVPEQ